jgi:phosphatidylglycerophosphate synthase
MARRFLAAVPAFLAIALFCFSLPVAATTTTGAETTTTAGVESGTTAATTGDGTGTTGAGTATTEATAPAVTIQPAVPVDTTPPEQTNPDWTYRFFIPTLLVLAALVVIVTVIQYFTRVVRNRYRTVR